MTDILIFLGTALWMFLSSVLAMYTGFERVVWINAVLFAFWFGGQVL